MNKPLDCVGTDSNIGKHDFREYPPGHYIFSTEDFMNKAERAHIQAVVDLGCIVCRNEGLGETPCCAHHINCGAMGKKSSNYEILGLCPNHHQYADGTEKFGGHIAVHQSLEKFEERYGTEQELLKQTLREVSCGH